MFKNNQVLVPLKYTSVILLLWQTNTEGGNLLISSKWLEEHVSWLHDKLLCAGLTPAKGS